MPNQPAPATADVRMSAGQSPIDPAQLVDQLADAVIVADVSGRIRLANAAAERLFGYSSGTLHGLPLIAIIPPRLRAAHRAAFDRFVTTGVGDFIGSRAIPVSALRADESELPVELALGAMQPAKDGELVIVATLRDMRDRVMLEHQALASRYLQATVDAARDGVIAWSADQKILAVNRPFCDLLGLSPDAVPVGSDAVALLSEHLPRLDDPDRLLTAIAWALEHPTETQQLDLQLSDGRIIEGYAAPILDDDARQLGRVWFLRDDTDRRIQDEQRRRLVVELATAQRAQQFLLDASAVLAHTSGFAETLNALAGVAVPTLGDLCLIDVLDERNRLVRMAAVHADPAVQPLVDELRHRYPPDPGGEHPSVSAISSRASRWAAEMSDEFLRATTHDDHHYELVKRLKFTSYVTVPLVVRDQALGTLTVVSAGSDRRFREEDVALAEELADRVALVVNKERRYDIERQISHTLQTNLLPADLPVVDGVSFAVRYLPGTLDAEVGGDFWDVVTMPSGELAVAVGDVAGHDVTAAATMAQLRSACRALRAQTDGPETLISLLQDCWDQLGLDRIATAVFARLEAATGRLRIASAGHPPPVLVDDDGARLVPVQPAPPLGAPPGPAALWRGLLPAGGMLVFYTDGLVEDRQHDIDDGTRRLVEAVGTSGSRSADELADYLIANVARPERGDDVALLVVHRST